MSERYCTGGAMPLLAVRDAVCVYGALRALDGVSLRVQHGEIVVLVGRNGAGKSTLLRCIAAWTQLTDGAIHVDGLHAAREERELRRHVVLVPDTPSFYDDLTAWEHLRFVARARRLPEWERRAEGLLRRLGLWAQRDAFPLAYSRGMRYKLALCMALLVEPPLLLLDEPFGPLDPFAAGKLWATLLDCRRRGAGVLLSSHQLPPAAQPDRFVVIEEGVVVADDSPDELSRRLGMEIRSLDALLDALLAGREAAHADA